jgi:hypothetical protein
MNLIAGNAVSYIKSYGMIDDTYSKWYGEKCDEHIPSDVNNEIIQECQ